MRLVRRCDDEISEKMRRRGQRESAMTRPARECGDRVSERMRRRGQRENAATGSARGCDDEVSDDEKISELSTSHLYLKQLIVGSLSGSRLKSVRFLVGESGVPVASGVPGKIIKINH
jgi:hypothetical protein